MLNFRCQDAARSIQMHWRRVLARRRARAEAREQARRRTAAVLLQKNWRGYSARERVKRKKQVRVVCRVRPVGWVRTVGLCVHSEMRAWG